MSTFLAIAIGLVVGYVLCLAIQRLTARRRDKVARELHGGMDLHEVAGAHAPIRGSAALSGNPYGGAKSTGM